MTTLIVRPIDSSAPGSFRQRSKLMQSIAMMNRNDDPSALAEAYLIVESLVLDRCETDDGTSVEEVLDQLSADDFDKLLESLAGENTVPTESAES